MGCANWCAALSMTHSRFALLIVLYLGLPWLEPSAIPRFGWLTPFNVLGERHERFHRGFVRRLTQGVYVVGVARGEARNAFTAVGVQVEQKERWARIRKFKAAARKSVALGNEARSVCGEVPNGR
jgi:hypothetical protein